MTSVIVSSNLRRAQETVAVALWDRLQVTKEPILVIPLLQEISRNFDTFSIAKPMSAPNLPHIFRFMPLTETKTHPSCAQLFDASRNTGNKALSGNGLQRLHAFAKW